MYGSTSRPSLIIAIPARRAAPPSLPHRPSTPPALSAPLPRGQRRRRCASRNGSPGGLKLAREEAREGRVGVAGERAAPSEALAFVECDRGLEGLRSAGFEAEALVTARLRLIDDMVEHRPSHAAAERAVGGAHRLDLAVIGRQLLQRADADQLAAVARCPEG